MSEHWSPVKGWESRYEVSTRGNVRSLDHLQLHRNGVTRLRLGQHLSPHVKGDGHLEITLPNRKKVGVHRLVLETFVGPCPTGMECCHNDGDPSNNQLENLRWDTHSNNGFDSVKHGAHPQARKTHCPRGHEYTIHDVKPSDGRRRCLRCAAECSRSKRAVA